MKYLQLDRGLIYGAEVNLQELSGGNILLVYDTYIYLRSISLKAP